MNFNFAEEMSVAFGKVVARLRKQRSLTPEALALAAGGVLSADDVENIEQGRREPRLSELFAIANALGEAPGVLFIDLIDQWRADPVNDRLYGARASDFARLYRLGYYEALGEFRELQKTFITFDGATAAADKLNGERHGKGHKPLDTVCIYIRMGHVSFRWEPEPVPPQATHL